mgnify:CR=1 FL=1
MIVKNISVLLVEDSPADARYVREMLLRPIYDIAHCDSLSQAFEDIGRHHFDVILLDLSLADSNGLETFEAIFERVPTIPIVILTGLVDEDVSSRAVKLGAQDYILKQDISQYTLSRAIRYAIERKQTEENSKRLLVLEQREEFMATLTHDLKNQLIGANRILELMAQQAMGVVSSEQSDLLLQVRDNNKMLLSMIQNLIEVYRFEKDINAVILENTNLLLIVSSCIKDIAPIAENRAIRIKTDFSEHLREVRADASAIRRVMQNLLDNALKFTPSGGEISLLVHPTNGCISVKIGDTGPGISTEEQAKLFQRFSQGRVGKKYTPGTGLGLYLCKQIVDAHNGQITCSSEEGRGTVFCVTLPAVPVAS